MRGRVLKPKNAPKVSPEPLTSPAALFIVRGLGIKCRAATAQVVKLVDTLASGASGRKAVEVQVLSWAPYLRRPSKHSAFFYTCPSEDQGPLALRASLRSRASWRIHAPGPGHHI